MVVPRGRFLVFGLPDSWKHRQFLGTFVVNKAQKEYPIVFSQNGKIMSHCGTGVISSTERFRKF